MADEVIDQQNNGADDQKAEENVETVTRVQFEQMKAQSEEIAKQFDALKKSQSGADSKVSELQKLLKLKEEEGKSEEEKFADRIKAIETELQSEKQAKQQAILKGVAISLLGEKGLKPPKYLDRLIGSDAQETEENINGYIEERLELELSIADNFAKNNGRTITKSKGDVKTMDDYSDAEISAMSNAEFEKVQDRSRK